MKTALDLLVNQVHEIWRDEDHVALLLSLDIIETYNHVMCSKLVHMLRAKEISKQLVEWVEVFITDRISTLILSGMEIKERPISVKVS